MSALLGTEPGAAVDPPTFNAMVGGHEPLVTCEEAATSSGGAGPGPKNRFLRPCATLEAWGNQSLLTAVAVIGSLGGVALGGWLTARRDDTQWAREKQQRQEDALRGVCAAFVAAAIECRRLLEQLHYFQRLGRDAEILTFGEEYNHKSRDLHREAAQLRFLGSATLITAADDIVVSVAHSLQAVKRAESVSSAADVRADLPELEELKRSVNAFVDQARSHDGVGPGVRRLDGRTSR